MKILLNKIYDLTLLMVLGIGFCFLLENMFTLGTTTGIIISIVFIPVGKRLLDIIDIVERS